MFSKRQTIFGCIIATFVFVALGVPSTAFAANLEKASVRAQFDESLSESDRVNFTDDKFDTYSADGLNGYIATNDDFGLFVLEGEETKVEDAINDLETDSRLSSVTVLDRSYPDSANHSSLASHTELDPRNLADAESYTSEVKKVRVRAKYAGGLSDSKKLGWHDSYFEEFAADGLGGLFIPGHGSKWITIELEGPEVRVDYWVDQLKNDEDLESANVLSSEYNEGTTAYELVSHTWEDERKSN